MKLGLLLCLVLVGADPASQPASQLVALVDQLRNPDSQRREEAFHQLLTLRPDQLPLLSRAVADAGPMLPGQTSLLRQVVRHVYISGAKYPTDPGSSPFLGLSWDPKEMPEWEELGGVPVMRRVPGFAAYQSLREGDVIQGVEELPNIIFRSTVDVSKAVLTFKAGQTITLRILRDGKPKSVHVQLRARPLLADNLTALDIWIEEQTAAADRYWESHFTQVLEGNVI